MALCLMLVASAAACGSSSEKAAAQSSSQGGSSAEQKAESGKYSVLAELEDDLHAAGSACTVGEWEHQTWMSASQGAYCEKDNTIALLFTSKKNQKAVIATLKDDTGLDKFKPKALSGDLWVVAGPGAFMDSLKPALGGSLIDL